MRHYMVDPDNEERLLKVPPRVVAEIQAEAEQDERQRSVLLIADAYGKGLAAAREAVAAARPHDFPYIERDDYSTAWEYAQDCMGAAINEERLLKVPPRVVAEIQAEAEQDERQRSVLLIADAYGKGLAAAREAVAAARPHDFPYIERDDYSTAWEYAQDCMGAAINEERLLKVPPRVVAEIQAEAEQDERQRSVLLIADAYGKGLAAAREAVAAARPHDFPYIERDDYSTAWEYAQDCMGAAIDALVAGQAPAAPGEVT